MNRNRLMHADELHKFSDGTLDDVWSALNDIAKGIRMEYLPMRKWSNLDKKRAWVMVQDIDKQLYQRRLMRNLEKFVGGRDYGKDRSTDATKNHMILSYDVLIIQVKLRNHSHDPARTGGIFPGVDPRLNRSFYPVKGGSQSG
ncbi:hypothetical protein Tco_0352580 [Tanacetum coccineum]